MERMSDERLAELREYRKRLAFCTARKTCPLEGDPQRCRYDGDGCPGLIGAGPRTDELLDALLAERAECETRGRMVEVAVEVLCGLKCASLILRDFGTADEWREYVHTEAERNTR